MSFLVRPARIQDIGAMTRLIEQRRESYERLEPLFWKRAAGSARTTKWFYTWLLLPSRRTLALVADGQGELLGFLIARRVRTPRSTIRAGRPRSSTISAWPGRSNG
jgi:hypothetical protein